MDNQRPETAFYLVPTPIGNLEDITFRAVSVLKSVNVILAEDTRVTKKLLSHYGITTKCESYHAHNEHKMTDAIIERLKQGQKLALVSDAGTPGISDPGFLLAKACLEHDIKFECLPGATAFVPALIKSSFANDRFMYVGFIPHKKGRQTFFTEIEEFTFTTVMYESPHRLVKTLSQLKEILTPDRQVSVSREITKMFEETKNGTASELLEYYTEHPPKGEIVIALQGKTIEKVSKRNKYSELKD